METLLDVAPTMGIDPEMGLLFATLEDGTREWMQYLADVPDEVLVWQPTPGGHSIGGLMLHIADVEGLWIEERLLGRSRPEELLARLPTESAAVRAGNWNAPPAWPFAEYVDLLKTVRERTRALLAELPPPEHTIPHPRPGVRVTARWALAHVVHHESYHGGQAVLLKAQWDARKG